MTNNPQFPNYANGPAGTEVIGWTVVGGQPLYRLPVAYIDTRFGAAFVCEGSTTEAPTYPDGVYAPDPKIESAGEISGTPTVGSTLTFTPGTVTGTQPVTVSYNWIRYIPGGTSLIVGTGLSYVAQAADVTHTLIVQTVASNVKGTVATQTVPYSPITSPAPVITDPGTISKLPSTNPFLPSQEVGQVSHGNLTALTLTNPGEGYIYLLGAPTLDIQGDGTGAAGTAVLAEEGKVVAVGEPSGGTGVFGTSGTITISGEGAETDIVLNWEVEPDPGGGVGEGPILLSIADPGSGWTQNLANEAAAGNYGTVVYTNAGDVTTQCNLGLFIGVPLANVVLTDGGSGYTSATVTVVPAAGDVVGSGATVSATVAPPAPADKIYPGDTLSYTGATIVCSSPFTEYITWVNADNPQEVWQLGGDTFLVPESAAGDNVAVSVVAINSEGTTQALSNTLPIEGYLVVVKPSAISQVDPLLIDTKLTGTPAVYDSVPDVSSLVFGFYDVTDPDNPLPLALDKLTYTVQPLDYEKSILFRTTATAGQFTVTSDSATLGPATGSITVVTKPTITGYTGLAYPGKQIAGVPAEFDGVPPIASVVSQFFSKDYKDPNAPLIPLAPVGTSTYTLQQTDVDKQIYFISTATNAFAPAGYPSVSDPITVVPYLAFLDYGDVFDASSPGSPIRVGATIGVTEAHTSPENQNYGGPAVSTSQVGIKMPGITYYYRPGDVIPATRYGGIIQLYTTTTLGAAKIYGISEAKTVGGAPPTFLTSGSLAPGDTDYPYNIGTKAVYTSATVDPGAPGPLTELWNWFIVDPGTETKTQVQQGGYELTILKAWSGKTIRVEYTATNPAGSISNFVEQNGVIPPPTVRFLTNPPLTGSTVFSSAGAVTLQYMTATATDGTGDPITITKRYVGVNVNGALMPYPIAVATEQAANTVLIKNGIAPPITFEDIPRAPGDPRWITNPYTNAYLAIEWTAVNPKTGGTAKVISPVHGPMTMPSMPYQGLTPIYMTVTNIQRDTATFTLTLPTFQGGSIAVSSVKWWEGGIYPFNDQMFAEGTLTYTGGKPYSPGGSYVECQVSGSQGTYKLIYTLYR